MESLNLKLNLNLNHKCETLCTSQGHHIERGSYTHTCSHLDLRALKSHQLAFVSGPQEEAGQKCKLHTERPLAPQWNFTDYQSETQSMAVWVLSLRLGPAAATAATEDQVLLPELQSGFSLCWEDIVWLQVSVLTGICRILQLLQ